MRLDGPASRAPELGPRDEDGDTSTEGSGEEDCGCKAEDSSFSAGAEASIAVDPVLDVKPVRALKALGAQIQALQTHAEAIIRNEKTVRIEDRDGNLQPVPDEGGRQCMQSVILDVRSASRSFGEKSLASVECAIANTDRRTEVCPMALAIPTEKALDSFDARTWPACYVEWWFGDGAPGLNRERPMLFEECARRLIDLEEMEYTLSTDDVPYEASSQSRYVNPEIVAVLGDGVRRMKMLRGTKAAIGHRGFDAVSYTHLTLPTKRIV